MRSGSQLIKEIRAKVKEVDPSEVRELQSQNGNAPDDLVVVDARAEEGPTIKRYKPRAQGRAFPIHKPMTHITVVVEDREA